MYYRRKRFISFIAVLMATCLIGAVGLSVYTHFAGTYRYPPVGSLEEINLRFVQLQTDIAELNASVIAQALALTVASAACVSQLEITNDAVTVLHDEFDISLTNEHASSLQQCQVMDTTFNEFSFSEGCIRLPSSGGGCGPECILV